MTDQPYDEDLNPSQAVNGLDPQDALVADPKPSTDVAHTEGTNHGDPAITPDPDAQPVGDGDIDVDDADLDGVAGGAS